MVDELIWNTTGLRGPPIVQDLNRDHCLVGNYGFWPKTFFLWTHCHSTFCPVKALTGANNNCQHCPANLLYMSCECADLPFVLWKHCLTACLPENTLFRKPVILWKHGPKTFSPWTHFALKNVLSCKRTTLTFFSDHALPSNLLSCERLYYSLFFYNCINLLHFS
jgi:hypothetical protein